MTLHLSWAVNILVEGLSLFFSVVVIIVSNSAVYLLLFFYARYFYHVTYSSENLAVTRWFLLPMYM